MLKVVVIRYQFEFTYFQKKGKKKKDESEEGEISSNDSAREEEFDDGLDEDLIGDDKDR